MPPDFELIKAVVRAGQATPAEEHVDPSEFELLRDAGVGVVTRCVEQLIDVGLVDDPAPILGGRGGMWIGYRLTDLGRDVAGSDEALRQAVGSLIGGPQSSITVELETLRRDAERAPLRGTYREDFLRTLEEIQVCYDAGCYIASISLCGKILEVCLKEVMETRGLDVDPLATSGRLIRQLKNQMPDEYLDRALENVLNLINVSRNTQIHANERIPVPSADQARMVMHAMMDLVRRKLLSA